MSQLNKIVRRVLLEASPVVQGGGLVITGKPGADEPHDAATPAQTKVTAAAKQVKIDNAISPKARVDPSAYVESSSIGYNRRPQDIIRLRKMKPRDADEERDIEDAKTGGDSSQVIGDSAVSDSRVHTNSIVKNSTVSDSRVNSSTLSSCDLSNAVVVSSSLDSCKVRNSSTINGFSRGAETQTDFEERQSAAAPTRRHFKAMYTSFDSVYATGNGTISTSKLSKCGEISLEGAKTRIAGSTITGTIVFLDESGRRPGTISVADIDESEIGVKTVGSSVIIKGIPGTAVDIGYAHIKDSASVIATKAGKPPKVIGFPTQPAVVSGYAKVYDSAYVSGKVEENAEVFGDAKVEGLATIKGNCKVGGTAVMVSGVFTKGEYMEGRHEGGDEGAAEAGSVTSRLKSMLGID